DHALVQRDVVPEDGIRVEVEIRSRRWTELTLERADDVLRDDLGVLQRRRVVKPAFEVEGPGEPVRGHARQRGRQIRAQLRPALTRGSTVVREQRPEQAAAEELERVRVTDLLRVEGIEVAPVRSRQRVSLLVSRPAREPDAKRAASEG